MAIENDELLAAIRSWVDLPNLESLDSLLLGADEWAISRGMAELVTAIVTRTERRSILEFGAGRSSLVLASALEQRGGGRLTSVEHQPQYAEASWRRLGEFPSVDAQMIDARLARALSRNGLLYEYIGIDRALRTRAPFDLVFIDAPPGHLGRDATLFAAAPYLAPGALIVLDDASRPAERTAVQRWTRGLRVESVFESDTVGRGVAVLRCESPSTAAFSLRTFLGLLHDRVVQQQS